MSIMLEREASPRARSAARYDVAVVGAGPYGLSTAAHLLARGLTVAVFGKTMELWRNHMPKGMRVRSHWWATDLSDPRKQYTFGRFLSGANVEKSHPLPREVFIEYALWFKDRAVPNVDETYVSSIERQDGHFLLTLEDGRSVECASAVMAIGHTRYAYCPEPYTHLPARLVSHSCDHNDFSRFAGKQVVVIGGGQSALEYSALLHEVGAAVHVVARRPIRWLAHDRADDRTVLEQILAPNTVFAPGWVNWIMQHMPLLMYHLPQHRIARAIRKATVAGASDWVRNRVIGKATLHEGHTVVKMDAVNGHVDVTISDGVRLKADHVVLATGYKVDINNLTMIHPSLKAEVKTLGAFPILSDRFESSVPGLYFVGLTSRPVFGPLFGFVAGCTATARRVAGSVAGTMARRRNGYRVRRSTASAT